MKKLLSPYLICFGQLPRIDVLSFYNGSMHIFKNKHVFLKQLILLNNAVNAIRLTMIERRKYKEENSLQAKYFEKIQTGSIVSIINPEVRRKLGNYKLLPKFRDQFVVIKRTKSCAFIKPCDEAHMKKFLEPKQCYQDQEPELTFKVDIENLKYETGVTILSSNQNAKFYSDFLQGHKIRCISCF